MSPLSTEYLTTWRTICIHIFKLKVYNDKVKFIWVKPSFWDWQSICIPLYLYHILTDPCSTMACGHLCVNAKIGPRCLCAEGFQLVADGKNCTGCNHCHTCWFIFSIHDRCSHFIYFSFLFLFALYTTMADSGRHFFI